MLFLTFFTHAVRKIYVMVCDEVFFKVLPVVLIVSDFFAPGADRQQTSQLKKFADIFNNEQCEIPAVKMKQRCRDQGMDDYLPVTRHDGQKRLLAMYFSAAEGLMHGIPDNTVMTQGVATTSFRRCGCMDAVKGIASAFIIDAFCIAHQNP